MPRVPRITGPSVAEQPLVGGLVRPVEPIENRSGERLAGALMTLGTTLGDAHHRHDAELAEAAAKDADSQFTQQLTDRLYHPERGYMSQQGRAAAETYEPLAQEIETTKRRVLGTLKDPRARQLAEQSLSMRANTALQTASRHAAAEGHRWKLESSEARAEASLLAAAADPSNAVLFDDSLNAAFAEADSQARLQGWDEATTEDKRRRYVDQAYERRYAAWAGRDPVAALTHFATSGGVAMTPLQREQVRNKLFHAAAPVLADQLLESGGPGVIATAPAAASGAPTGPAPRGIRNNNPGNIVKTDRPWQGEVLGSDSRYASFDSPEAGIRAMARTLSTYGEQHGLNTVQGIVARWAPASENPTTAYIKAVAKDLGVKPGQPLDLKDPAIMGGLVRAIIKHENGQQPYSDEQIARGITAAGNAEGDPAALPPPAAMREPGGPTGHALIDALPPQQRLQVLQMARARGAQAMSDMREQLRSRIKDAEAEYLATGIASNPPPEAEFIRAFGQREGIQQHREFLRVADLGRQIQQVRNMPQLQIEELLEQAKPDPGEGFADRQRNYETLQRAAQQVTEQRRKDPITYALRSGTYPIKPLAKGDLPELMTELPRRSAAAVQIATSYGTPVALLTDREAEQVAKTLNTLALPEKQKALTDLASVIEPQTMGPFAAQLGKNSEPLALAMFASRFVSSEAADLILRGQDARGAKRIKDDSGTKAAHQEIARRLDAVPWPTPAARDRAVSAAQLVYDGMRDASGSASVKDSITRSGGEIIEWAGLPVPMPPGMNAQAFRRSLERMSASDLASRAGGPEVRVGTSTMTVEQLITNIGVMRLIPTGPGEYALDSAGALVQGKDGKPLRIRLARN